MDNRKTLCFLHGWGFGCHIWPGFVKEFLPDWNVITPALPGYDGAVPRALGIDDVARALLADVPANSILIGWSLGGLIGIKIATLQPVRKLILLAGAPCFVKKNNWPCGIEVEVIEGLMRSIMNKPGRALREFALLSSRGDKNPRATYRILSTLLKEGRTHTDALMDGLNMLLQADLRTEFSALKCRTGVILAENDQLLSVFAGAAMRPHRSSLELDIIQGAGHAPFISSPDKTRRSLLAMLEPGVAV